MSDKEYHVQRAVEVKFTANSNAQWSTRLDVPFMPNEVIVKQINYWDVTANAGVYSIYCDGLGGHLGSFFSNTVQSPNLVVTLESKQIAGDFTFQARLLGQATSVPNGYLSITLEFVKHRSKPELRYEERKDRER